MRRSLGYRLSEFYRVYRLLRLLRGVLVLALLICLSHLRKRLFFFCFSLHCYRDEGWIRPGLPSLRKLAGSLQHFWADAWRLNAASKFCWALLDVTGSRQLLFSSHLRDWDKMLLRSICGGWSHLHLTSFASLTRPQLDLVYCFSLH